MAKAGKRGGDAVDALERSPSHLLHRALQLALDLYAEEAAPGAPTQRQYAVLSAVAARDGLTQTDLVRATGIDRSTLADLVARMIGKGLLSRERSSADGRANAVHLSEPGREALAQAAPRAHAADQRILACLPKSKREGFVTVLALLAGAGEKAMVKREKTATAPEADVTAKAAAPDSPDDAKPAKAGKKAKDKKKKKKKKAHEVEAPEPFGTPEG
ncbi:MAG TPA: MarR family winged helix-turn-helix transcriptional regulator [Caulobacteraceae bacterium]|jgi:DNA-binding MarR family transcriptional regulator|nr:MarR family winged helix-turn-helix transcriptional regulator [Caulobacteraceae bacterium]